MGFSAARPGSQELEAGLVCTRRESKTHSSA